MEKFNPSKQQLRTYLFKKAINKNQKITNKKELINLIDVIIESLENQKLISDEHYSDVKSRGFLRRGYSLNKIRYSLIKKGIEADKVDKLLSEWKERQKNREELKVEKSVKNQTQKKKSWVLIQK